MMTEPVTCTALVSANGLTSAWLLMWGATLVVAALLLLAAWPWPNGWLRAGLALAAAVIGYIMQWIVSPYLGDVARYVRADPRNIKMRADIRDRGLKLLKEETHALQMTLLRRTQLQEKVNKTSHKINDEG